MEEAVGIRWHKLITHMAQLSYPQHSASLTNEQQRLALVLRALGGDAGLNIRVAAERRVHSSRHLLQKIAGTGLRWPLAWRDHDTLYLPAEIALYPDEGHNRDLYLWLTALASCNPLTEQGNWFSGNQQAVLRCLRRFPGLSAVYQRLVDAETNARRQRIRPRRGGEVREQAIVQALQNPGTCTQLPDGPGDPDPVPLWLYPAVNSGAAPVRRRDSDSDDQGAGSSQQNAGLRRQASYAEDPDSRHSLTLFRLESLLSWSEFIPLDRASDDTGDEDASRVAEDLDNITLSTSRGRVASRIRLDLDLPSAAEDDIPLSTGNLYPEWDYRKQRLLNDYCRVIPMLPRAAVAAPLPPHLQPLARRLRRQFAAFGQQPLRQKHQLQGQALDLNACITHQVQRQQGNASSHARVWQQQQPQGRDLSCLVLADLSLSTDAWANNERQVIDVIRDSLHLLGEALDASQDNFALYGFSSRRRDHVRLNMIKNFREPMNNVIHGRIQALKPGYYTRMGAAIRQAGDIINDHPADKRLLLILTDGKPNDLDLYEGRYGLEDTRMALLEARRAGIITYCVTIDQSTGDYIPYVFGHQGYFRLSRADQLPAILPGLYLNLSGKLQ
ncbi:nitric oxide reductase activation protein NorD [Thalassolituus marinus]|uniref:VWA domain-containing protein n=1 Tax=Thalassolituus marinus TaxID=671053 RepID=A0ABS7ZPR6_9GAMM|nr:VWA domain-containing protein [Thalassolituus marinus]MCA6063719.1 VWA domain-containing protein [Thalassolituus marinus]